MRTTIELTESVYRRGAHLARTRGVTLEQYIAQTFERELISVPENPSNSGRVTLPLIRSREPGAIDLKDFNFDDLLA